MRRVQLRTNPTIQRQSARRHRPPHRHRPLPADESPTPPSRNGARRRQRHDVTGDEVAGAAHGAAAVDRAAVDDDDVAAAAGELERRGQPDDAAADDDDSANIAHRAHHWLAAFIDALPSPREARDPMNRSVFHGCLPALMTPCDSAGRVLDEALVATATRLMDAGMSGVVYCGSMGDWPLLSDEQRRHGVEVLVAAGIPVVVGTGAQSPARAAEHAAHAASVGAAGLMVIPRVLSRGISPAAQRAHFDGVLGAAPELPSVIYNSPYYGFETRADLFFELRDDHPNLVGYKEFGGRQSLSYAAEHITSGSPDLDLLVGVDTQVVHGIVYCGAVGVITGIGNVLPDAVLTSIRLARAAAGGDPTALRLALELEVALGPLAEFDEGADLVLFYKHLAVLAGHKDYEHHLNPTDALSASQRRYATDQFERFTRWWSNWDGRDHGAGGQEPPA